MLFQTLILLLAFASLFGIIAGMSKDRVYLIPMAGILLLASSMMLSSGSLMVQDGTFTEVQNTVDGDNATDESYLFDDKMVTVESGKVDQIEDELVSYRDVNQLYSFPFQFTTAFSIVLMIISLYSFFLGADLTGTIRRS